MNFFPLIPNSSPSFAFFYAYWTEAQQPLIIMTVIITVVNYSCPTHTHVSNVNDTITVVSN